MDKIEVVGGKGETAIQVIDLLGDTLATVLRGPLHPVEAVLQSQATQKDPIIRPTLKRGRGVPLIRSTWVITESAG